MTAPPIISIIGKSNSGKTTLIEALLPELQRRGYRVATIKHHAHTGKPVDVPGKDSWRYARAGAERVIIIAPNVVVSYEYAPRQHTLREVAAQLAGFDLVLAEGFKRAGLPAIEVSRAARSTTLVGDPAHLLAVAADHTPAGLTCPLYRLDDIVALVDLIAREVSEQH